MCAQYFAAAGNLKPFRDGLLRLAAGDGFGHKARKIILAMGMTNPFCHSSRSLPPTATAISPLSGITPHLDRMMFAVMLHVTG